MSSRIPAGFGELVIQWRLPADPEPMLCAIGLDLAVGVVPNVTEANLMISVAANVLDNVTSAAYTLGAGWVTYGQDGPDDIRVEGTETPIAGAGVGTALPNNCAALLRKVTNVGGRRGRGRMYVPGVLESSANEVGDLSAAALAAYVSAGTSLVFDLTALATIDSLVILHSSAPFTPTPITDITAAPRIATQRRRMRP